MLSHIEFVSMILLCRNHVRCSVFMGCCVDIKVYRVLGTNVCVVFEVMRNLCVVSTFNLFNCYDYLLFAGVCFCSIFIL